MIRERINKSLDRFYVNYDYEPRFIVLDAESYFELKLEEFGSTNAAIANELDTYLGLRVFYNVLGYSFIDIA